ncbi:MAG: VCBS repeat-containing protein, partial [Planctomycetaceae bacterium]|nr:VCBS repeat-containing protein [Planctomycetaceae bacterium]
HAGISFEDVTAGAGMYNESKGWCAAWGDYNGDGWPDLYVNNHQFERRLYLNLKGGSFAETSSAVFDYQDGQELKDSHGCIWLDFDNDGDQDLAQVSGGNGGRGEDVPVTFNEFFVNENGMLIDKAVEMEIAYPEARGRTVSALDYDNDGLLDLFYGTLEYSNSAAPSKIYHQDAGTYVESTQELGLAVSGSINYS